MTSATNAAYAQLWQLSGVGSPQVIATTAAATNTSAATVSVDVTAYFRTGGTAVAGDYAVEVYLANNGTDWATSYGSSLQFTP